MNITNERQLLSVVRDATTGNPEILPKFIEKIEPLFDDFIAKGTEKDEYGGWTFKLKFVRSSSPECEPYHSILSSSDTSWVFCPKGKDDCIYAIPGKGLVAIHLHSFLWNI